MGLRIFNGINLLIFISIIITNISNNGINSQQLTLTISNSTVNNNVFVGSSGALYVVIPDQSTCFVDITCSKTSNYQGTLYVTVNTEAQNNGNCNSYIPNAQQVDVNCLTKKYTTDLTALTSYNIFLNRIPVYCRINEDSSKFLIQDLIRLYADNKARTRRGIILYNSINTFDVNDQINCEAIADSASGTIFDNIQWYAVNSQNNLVNFNMVSLNTKITPRFTNYSVAFKLTSSNINLYSGYSYFKCCTTLGGNPIFASCVDANIQGNLSTTAAPTTAATTTVSTTRTSVTGTTTTTTTTTKVTTTAFNATPSALPIVPSTTAKTGLSSSEIGIIVGSIAGAIVLGALILLALCCYCTYLRRRKRFNATLNINNHSQSVPGVSVVRSPSKTNNNNNNGKKKPTNIKGAKAKTKQSGKSELSFTNLPEQEVKNKKTIKKVNEDPDVINAYNERMDNSGNFHFRKSTDQPPSQRISMSSEIENNRTKSYVPLPPPTPPIPPPPPPAPVLLRNSQLNDMRESQFTSIVNVIPDDAPESARGNRLSRNYNETLY